MNSQIDRGYKELKFLLDIELFVHFVSLGHNCYVASDLAEMGLREASLPFDWTRTKWCAVERSFDTQFDGMLDYSHLYQKKEKLTSYKNMEYGIGYYHDFSQYKSLRTQINAVKKKYARRVNRFFRFIQLPTLFVRYCMDENELIYIANHYNEIEKRIKVYNKQNEIVFISHDSFSFVDLADVKFIFFIDKNHNCELNSHPIKSSEVLYELLKNANYKMRNNNLEFEKNKIKRKKEKSKKLICRIQRKLINFFPKKVYIHEKQC